MVTARYQQPMRELPVGSPVFCRDGEALGHVKAVRDNHFKVNAPLQPDYWLRRDTVAAVTADGVMLLVAKDQLGSAQVGDPSLDPGPPPASGAAAAVPPDYVPAPPPDTPAERPTELP